MKKKYRRKYQKKLSFQLIKHKEFLLEKLRGEWDQIQREAKREQIVRQVKEAGQVALATTAKIILTLTVIGGILTVAAIAPNVFGAVGQSMRRKCFFNKKNFNKAKHYLKRQNYIKIYESDETFKIELTDKGLIRAFQITFDGLKIPVAEKWDGFWRIVIFDIPNRHKWAREGFREKLREMGFYLLQESVFIIPFPCEKQIQFLVSMFNLSSYVRLIKAQDFNPDSDVKQYFNLH
jgi:hypothetical protein